MNIVNGFINAAAVWFLLKSVEVIPMFLYDLFAWAQHDRSDNDGARIDYENYDRRRGRFEYVLSGAGFLNWAGFRESKKWFIVSTLVPIVVFIIELSSIFLGFETKTCNKSADPNVISAPCLQLFGTGTPETSMGILINQSIEGGSSLRPCVTWSSSHMGVEYEASICGALNNVGMDISLLQSSHPSDNWIGQVLPKRIRGENLFYLVLVVSMPNQTSFSNATLITSMKFDSEVRVNNEGTLLQDVTRIDEISEGKRKQLLDDVRRFEDYWNLSHAELYEDENVYGFQWDSIDSFRAGSDALVFAVLAQATRGPVKSATEMSSANTERPSHDFDISCHEDFRLSRNLSIVIIATAVVFRLMLTCMPATISSVSFALTAEEMKWERPEYDPELPPQGESPRESDG